MPATFLLVCFLSLKGELVKLGKMLFTLLEKLFSFFRKSNIRILDIQIYDIIKRLSIKKKDIFLKN